MPSDYALTIILDGNDITSNCPYETYRQDTPLRTPGYFSLTVQNPSFEPLHGMALVVIAKNLVGAPVIFSGFVMELSISKRSNAIALEYAIEAGDFRVLLQKSVIPFGEYTGTESEIIADLFNDTYPDLSPFFDFSSGVEDFGEDLSFNTNDENLLDALNRFADSRGANMRFETNTGEGNIVLRFTPDTDVIEAGVFNAGGATPYWYAPFPTQAWAGGYYAEDGNPNHCIRLTLSYTAPTTRNGYLNIHMGSAVSVTNIIFDIKITHSNALGVCQAHCGDDAVDVLSSHIIEAGRWHTINAAEINPGAFPFTVALVSNEYRLHCGGSFGSINNGGSPIMYIDNVIIEATVPLQTGGKDKLDFSPFPDLADFDFDIQNSTEFGADFDLNLGSIDDFNSVTVVGGKERVAVTWVYDADGSSERVQLEAPIKGIAVSKNTGTDTSPIWTAQTVGTLGTDTLGDVDVLYDPTNHWLWFDTAPDNLTSSVQVTGFIEKPIRVRVENVGDGELVQATVITNENITSEEDAIAYANALLAKKNAPRRLDFITYEAGLQVGQELTVADSARGLSETLIIQRITTRWIGSASAEFTVECGEDEGVALDTLIAGIDEKTDKQSVGAGLNTSEISPYLDDDGLQLYDDDNALLYEVG
jgi:hypothetical protein